MVLQSARQAANSSRCLPQLQKLNSSQQGMLSRRLCGCTILCWNLGGIKSHWTLSLTPLALISNPTYHTHAKHIDVQHKFVGDRECRGEVKFINWQTTANASKCTEETVVYSSLRAVEGGYGSVCLIIKHCYKLFHDFGTTYADGVFGRTWLGFCELWQLSNIAWFGFFVDALLVWGCC
jgi:hypothetical protein